jgi:hypothetical protein
VPDICSRQMLALPPEELFKGFPKHTAASSLR